MKRKLLILLSALLILAIPTLVACKPETTEMKLSDYAKPVEAAIEDNSLSFYAPSFSLSDAQPTRLASNSSSYSIPNGGLFVRTEDSSGGTTTYGLATMHGDVIFQNEYSALFVYSTPAPFVYVEKPDTVGYALYSLDGAELLPFANYDSYNCVAFNGKHAHPLGKVVFSIRYSVDSGEPQTKYVYLPDDAINSSYFRTCSADDLIIPEDDRSVLDFYRLGEGPAGNMFSPARYPEPAMPEYSFAIEDYDDTATIYIRKNGLIKSLTIENYSSFTVLDGKLFIMTEKQVDAEAKKGYNQIFRIDNNENAMKLLIQYYEYDLATEKMKELKLPYSIMSAYPMYNYAKGAYDALLVDAILEEDGVATLHDQTFLTDRKTYLIDTDGAIGVTLPKSGASYYAQHMYKLENNRVLIRNSSLSLLVDDNAEVIADTNNISNVVPSSRLIFINGRGAIDYDGKVAIGDGVNGTVSGLINGCYVSPDNPLAGEPDNYIFSPANPEGLKIETADGEIVSFTMYNLFFVKTKAIEGGYEHAYYRCDGKPVFTIQSTSSSIVYVSQLTNSKKTLVFKLNGYYDITGSFVQPAVYVIK